MVLRPSTFASRAPVVPDRKAQGRSRGRSEGWARPDRSFPRTVPEGPRVEFRTRARPQVGDPRYIKKRKVGPVWGMSGPVTVPGTQKGPIPLGPCRYWNSITLSHLLFRQRRSGDGDVSPGCYTSGPH